MSYTYLASYKSSRIASVVFERETLENYGSLEYYMLFLNQILLR